MEKLILVHTKSQRITSNVDSEIFLGRVQGEFGVGKSSGQVRDGRTRGPSPLDPPVRKQVGPVSPDPPVRFRIWGSGGLGPSVRPVKLFLVFSGNAKEIKCTEPVPELICMTFNVCDASCCAFLAVEALRSAPARKFCVGTVR